MVKTNVVAENAQFVVETLQERGCKIVSCTLTHGGFFTEIQFLPKPGTDRMYYLGLVHGIENGIAYKERIHVV